jgi:hypothetical protein
MYVYKKKYYKRGILGNVSPAGASLILASKYSATLTRAYHTKSL